MLQDFIQRKCNFVASICLRFVYITDPLSYAEAQHLGPSIRAASIARSSLTGLNLSVYCGCCFELSPQTSFPPTAQYTWLYNNIQVNQSQVFRAPSVFPFRIIIRFYAILRVFVLYPHYDSISSKKLNGHQAFESMSFSGALIFLLKQNK